MEYFYSKIVLSLQSLFSFGAAANFTVGDTTLEYFLLNTVSHIMHVADLSVYFYVYEWSMNGAWMDCLHVCMCTVFTPCACRARRGHWTPGTAVKGVSLHLGARNWRTPSAVSASALNLWAISPVTMYIFFSDPVYLTISTTLTEESHHTMPLEFVSIV